MTLNNDSVRDKLIEITNQGLMLWSIALNVGIDVNDLSRFKGGMECLKQSDVEILSEYLEVNHKWVVYCHLLHTNKEKN